MITTDEQIDDLLNHDVCLTENYNRAIKMLVEIIKKEREDAVKSTLAPVSKQPVVLHECQCEAPDPVEIKICLECDGVTH